MKELAATLTVLHRVADHLDQVLQDLGDAVADMRESGGDQR